MNIQDKSFIKRNNRIIALRLTPLKGLADQLHLQYSRAVGDTKQWKRRADNTIFL
jgi:hypothetical protein